MRENAAPSASATCGCFAQGPKSVEVALSLTVSAGGDVWVANFATEGTIAITMTWER